MDPDERAEGIAHLEAGATKTSRLAVYEYAYGSVYTIPRMVVPPLADASGQLHRIGGIAAFAEWLTTSGEGPKGATLLRLLDRPDQPYLAEEAQWYLDVAGSPSAAGELAAYFAHWQDLWTGQIQDTAWFQASKGLTYGRFESPSYLDAATVEGLDTAEAHLTSVGCSPPPSTA